jgi:hypothetical protein
VRQSKDKHSSHQNVLEGAAHPVDTRIARCRLVNNSREHYAFAFNGILAPDAKQDEVGLSGQRTGCSFI